MKTITESTEVIEKGRTKEGFISFVCRNMYTLITINLERLGFPFGGDEKEAAPLQVDRDEQFRAYVNNRLYILIMWVQRPQMKRQDMTAAKQHLGFFLRDMEHHFVDPYSGKDTANAYRWIRAYVRAYPNVTKKDRAQRAFEMIARIYESLNMESSFEKPVLAGRRLASK